MRSWSAMRASVAGKLRKLAGSGGLGDFFLRPLNRFGHDPAGVRGVPPLADANPLVGFEILIVGEEMLDLLEHDRRQVLPLADIGIIWEGRVDRYADQLFIAAM